MTNDVELKERFAAELLKTPENAFGAACRIFGMDTQTALRVSVEWVLDIVVLRKQAALLEEYGEEYYLPSQVELARKVWGLAIDDKADRKDKREAYKLYAEIRGWLKTGGGGVTVNNNVLNANRVMMLKDFGTDDNWEETAKKSQMKLVSNARD